MKTSLTHFRQALVAGSIMLLSVVRAEKPAFDEGMLRTRIAAGNIAAQYQLGRAFLRGEGVPRDLHQALALLKGAAEAGNAEAKGAYGFMIAKGMAVPADEAAGLEWIRKSAEAGVPASKLNLGIMTLKGQGTRMDQTAGLKLMTEAATLGNVDAQVRLAETYHFGGNGVAPSPDQAAVWALKAAEANNAWAQNLVGTMKEHAMGMPLDLKAAAGFYRRSAEQGEAKAQSNLGRLLSNGRAGVTDKVAAWYWLRLSALQAEITAVNFLPEFKPALSAQEFEQAEKRVTDYQKQRFHRKSSAPAAP